ncbi:polycystin-1-like protein 3 [Glandiceps talaboti]
MESDVDDEVIPKITSDLLKASSNIIETTAFSVVTEEDDRKCTESDKVAMSLMADAVDSCLNTTLLVMDRTEEDEFSFDSNIITAAVLVYNESAIVSDEFFSEAGVFTLTSIEHQGDDTDERKIHSSKFHGSWVNYYMCESPEILMSSPVLTLDLLDIHGNPLQATGSYVINETTASSLEVEISTEHDLVFGVNGTGYNSVMTVFIDSETSGVQYKLYVMADSKPDEVHFNKSWEITSGTKHRLMYNTSTSDNVHHFMLKINNTNETVHIDRHNITLSVAMTSCLYWNDYHRIWQSKGCWPGSSSGQDALDMCYFNHLTTFTKADFVVPVNDIDFDKVFTMTLTLYSSTVLIAVVSGFFVYSISGLWMRRKDKQDVVNWLAAAQVNNEDGHKYMYRITVYTGLKPRAGTKCKVAFDIDGEKGISRRIVLDSQERKLNIKSGSIHSLNASVSEYLGRLEKLQVILSKSKGKGYDPWFLDRIEVTDLNPEAEIKQYDFLCYEWLGKDNLVKTLEVAEEADKKKFKHLLYTKLRFQLFNDYLWGSIFSRQLPSHFTRIQRLSCIAAMLCLTMLANAMFYSSDERVAATKTVGYGDVVIALGTLYVAFISCLVTLPASILMVTLFEKSKRVNRITPTAGDDSGDDDDGDNNGSTKRPSNLLPRCFFALAWTLVIISVLLSTFFVIMYSLDWGPEVATPWLVSQLQSCALSAFMIDPLKAIIVAHGTSLMFFLLKKPLELDSDEEFRQVWIPPEDETEKAEEQHVV